ncbi:HET domain-containing protein [Fusarium falciforme]|uniref:HET domain-containing protein n=1 Tax=Fusarium falciforme TaxID=195108 RepID=UPI00230113DB|nr:HET domain-containing protein [Fusarium falciforme]WAO87654.1 HET domain-containing protein [Fusarium falciforme]
MAKVSHLCATCVYALGHPLDYRSPGEHHLTINAIRQAVQEGCFICSQIWNVDEQGLVIKRDENKAVDQERHLPAEYIIESVLNCDWKNQLILFSILDETNIGEPNYSDFELIPKRVAESVYGSPWPPLDDRTSSLLSLDQAYDWLTSCRAQHPSCNRLSKSGKWLPTRLIDIGSEMDDLWKLRVVAEEGLHTSALYITLSYRWGTDPSITLLASNIDEFCHGKRISSLPQTFQDLITVARRFSVRYVWIDALCIIQDSSQDWASESAAMQYVYANSICTIAASASSGPEGGLFRSRQPEVVCPAVVNVAYGDEAPVDCYIWDTKYWPRHFERSELLTRGWVFQERFLSPRVLYFGHDQILWECMTDHKCEGFPGGVPDHESDKSSYAIPSLEDSEVNRQGPLFSNTMFRLWTGLAWHYSECTLTKPTDKLAAFAGIAKLFQEHTGDDDHAETASR